MNRIGPRTGRDRAVSISVTHVLTIGVTTILIALLLTSAGTMLETETDRSAESSLETVGERLADEIGNVDRIASGDGAAISTEVSVTTSHPQTVANSPYTVELRETCTAALLDGSTDCLRLTAHDADVVVYVPIETDAPIDDGSSTMGGTIGIRYDGQLSITEGGR